MKLRPFTGSAARDLVKYGGRSHSIGSSRDRCHAATVIDSATAFTPISSLRVIVGRS
jgi:hypothetical protein